MKKILSILTIVSVFSCKAQSIIKNLDGSDGTCHAFDSNCYEKDIDNRFGKFVGQWKYQNGTTQIVIKLEKEIKYRVANNANYEDLLVGEYQYIENGVEKVNTLSSLTNPSISGYNHNVTSVIIHYNVPFYCAMSSPKSEIKLELNLTSPINNFIEGTLIVRYFQDNGLEKLEVCINDSTTLSGNVNDRIEIPDGLYVFIKQ